MSDDYLRVRKLAEFLVARQSQSGVSIDADDCTLLALEIELMLERLDMLDDILHAHPDIIAHTYHD
jgi:hypothetical protein